MSHHKLSSFKTLIKHSWHFYKKHWKKIVFVFLPVEVAILVFAFALKFGLTPARFSFVAALASIFGIVIIFGKVWRIMLVLSGGQIISQIEGSNHKADNTHLKVAQNILSIIWVGILYMLFASAIILLVLLAFLALLLLPFIILALLSRVSPSILDFIGGNGSDLSFTMLTLCLLGFVTASIFFISGAWFSFNALLLEGRKGLDALAVSMSLVRGRRWSIFWRLFSIVAIALTLASIILGPVYWAILEEAKPKLLIGLMLYSQYNVFPAWPEISSYLFIWKALLTAIASLVVLPVFMTLNFFLWKDIKASAPVFKEYEYVKMRKYIKICVWIGLVIAVLCSVSLMFAR